MPISKTKVLIVEDQAVTAMSIEENLISMGFQVTDIIDKGEKVVSSVVKNTPDLILMDIYLKDKMTGIEAAKKVNENYDIPVIFLSASSDFSTVEKAKKLQPYAYLIKPFNKQSLTISINMALDSYQRGRTLKKHNRLLQKVQRIAKLGHWELDIVDNKFSWDEKIFELFELNAEAFNASNKAFLLAIHPEDRRYVVEAYKNSLKSSEPFEIEHRIITKSGEVKYAIQTCETTYNKSGKPLRSVGIIQDITKQKLNQQALKSLEENNSYEPSGIHDIIFETDKSDKLVNFNYTAIALLGYSRKEFEEKTFWDFIHPDDINIIKNFKTILVKDGHSEIPKGRIIDKYGRDRYINLRAKAKYNVKGKFIGIKFIVSDQTTIVRKKLRQKLTDHISKNLYFFTSINELGNWVSKELVRVIPIDSLSLTSYNPGKEEVTIRYTSDKKYIYPSLDTLPVYLNKHNTPICLNGKELADFMINNSLSYFGIEGQSVVGVPFSVNNTSYALIVKSKTNRNYTEEDLQLIDIITNYLATFIMYQQKEMYQRYSENRFDRFISMYKEGVWTMDFENPISLDQDIDAIEHQILYDATISNCNMAMAKMYGYDKPSDMFETRFIDLFNIDSRRERLKVSEMAKTFIKNGFKAEDSMSEEIKKDGTVRHFINNTYGIIEDNLLTSIWGVQKSATKLLKEREKFKASEEKFNFLFKNSSDEVYLVDPESLKILDANLKACKNLGYTKSELLKLSLPSFVPFIKKNLEGISEKFTMGEAMYKMQKRKDGSLYAIKLKTKSFNYDDKKYILGIAKETGKKYNFKEDLIHLGDIISNSNDAIIGTDINGIINNWNIGAERLLKYKSDDIIGNSILTLFPDGQRNKVAKLLRKVESGEYLYNQKGTVVDKLGNLLTLRFTAIPSLAKSGNIRGYSLITKDTSEPEESDKFIKSLPSLNPHIVMRCDAELYVNYTNKPAKQIQESISEQNGRLHFWFISLLVDSINEGNTDEGEFECKIQNKWYRFIVKKQEPDKSIVFFGVEISDLKNSQDQYMKLVVNLEKLVKERTHSLELSQEYLTAVAGNANIILFQVSADKKFTMVQGAGTSRLFDYNGKIVGTPIESISKRQPAIVAYIEKSLLGEQIKHIVSRQGSHFEITYIPNISKSDAKNSMFGLAVDITEIVNSQKKYQESQEQYKHIIESSNETIFSLNANSVLTYINNEGVRLTGYPINELIGKTLYTLIRPDFTKKVEDYYKHKVKNKSREIILEYPIINKRGEERWVKQSVKIEYIKSDNSNVRSFQGVLHDITTERRAQLAMEETNRKMNDLTDAINAASLITRNDLDGVITDVNQRLCDVSGYLREELIGSEQNIFDSGYHDKKFWKEMNRKIRNGQIWRGEISNRARNGEIYWVDTVISPQLAQDKKPYAFLCFGIDITSRKSMENELRESEQRFRELFEGTSDLIQSIDIDGKIIYVNDSWEKVLGFKLTDDTNLSFWNIIDHKNNDKWKSHFETVTSTPNLVDKVELELTTKSGSIISVSGNSISSYSEGKILIRSIFHDITPRKEAEKDMLSAFEKEKQLGELKSKFVATASHQFRTPLTIIQSNIELLDLLYNKNLKVDMDRYDRISSRIQKEVKAMTSIINDMLILGKMSSKVEINMVPTNILELCEAVKQQYDQIQDDGRKLELKVEGKASDVNLDGNMINHAISNLVGNAFKYSKNTKNPELLLKYETDTVIIQIIDYGIGIDKSNTQLIFDPFFRASNAKDIGGTGLGLSIVREYIESNNGRIVVKSRLGSGSTFSIEFSGGTLFNKDNDQVNMYKLKKEEDIN